MDPELRAYLDRKSDAVGEHSELIEARLGARNDQVERRLDGLEAEVERMGAENADRFHTIEERLASLELRLGTFEGRVAAEFLEVRQQLAQLTLRMDNLTARVDRLEDNLLQLNGRVDALAEERRQRFRVVNDRLGGLAA
jgi:chromosome segregation ATPase